MNEKENNWFKYLKDKFLKDLSTIDPSVHTVFTPKSLVHEIVGQIPDVGKNKSVLVLFNLEFVVGLLYNQNVNKENITFYSDHPNKTMVAEKFGVKVITSLENIKMKFDVVVGNPPYQNGSQDGGQNKIYNQITKTAISLLTEVGTIAFITPTSVLKKSKRFSLVGQEGLKQVNFTADNYFNVGINICSWIVDKSYIGEVEVVHSAGVTKQSNKLVIHDYSKVDKDFATLYEHLKTITDSPDKRMFMQNAVDTTTGRSLVAGGDFKYPVYKIDKGVKKLVQYNKPKPKFYQKLKFIISMTKGFSDAAITIDTDDFDVAHLYTDVADIKEVENIKSFIFSEYFINHSTKWKAVDGYGYNYALKYLPPFDKTKKWTNDDVKAFIEQA
jgi:hypothetical protein